MCSSSMIATQCAWCREIRVNGRFVELGLNSLVHEIDLPADDGHAVHYLVSHGVCGPCKARLMGSARPSGIPATSSLVRTVPSPKV